MSKMANIKMSSEQLRHLIYGERVNIGAEAAICETGKCSSLYKIFVDYNKPRPMGESKEKKIEFLYDNPIEYSVRPISMVSLEDVIVGYEMTTDYSFDTYKLYQLSPQELICFLKRTKYILEYFESKGIIYGDLAPRNILLNRETGEIQFCDMDNIQVNGIEMEKVPSALFAYLADEGKEKNIHAFVHNKMTLEAFNMDEFYSSDYEVRKLFSAKGVETLHSMRNPKDFNGEYLISHLKK